MPPDIISLLQEARNRVERTKQAVELAIKLSTDVEIYSDDKGLESKSSKNYQTEWERFQIELDKEFRTEQISGIKRERIDQTRNLNKLLEQAASWGHRSSAPLNVQNEIEKIEAYIAELDEKLKELKQDS